MRYEYFFSSRVKNNMQIKTWNLKYDNVTDIESKLSAELMIQNSNILRRVLPPLTHPEHLSSPLDISLMFRVLYIIVCPFFLF
jgi:hypothetical protein